MRSQPGSKVPLPRENLLICLNGDGDFMSVVTYPTVDQAGDALIGADEAVNSTGRPALRRITVVDAKFDGQSVFVGLLPNRNNWRYEEVKKLYSASGQYVSSWPPPYPGVWRLVGRVRGRYRVNDASGDRFVFACSWSGIFEYLFAYIYTRTEDTPVDASTPLDIYRETLGTGPLAYLLHTDAPQVVRGPAQPRSTETCAARLAT